MPYFTTQNSEKNEKENLMELKKEEVTEDTGPKLQSAVQPLSSNGDVHVHPIPETQLDVSGISDVKFSQILGNAVKRNIHTKRRKRCLTSQQNTFFFLREIKQKVRAGVHKSTQRGCKQILKVEKTEEALSNQGGHKQQIPAKEHKEPRFEVTSEIYPINPSTPKQ